MVAWYPRMFDANNNISEKKTWPNSLQYGSKITLTPLKSIKRGLVGRFTQGLTIFGDFAKKNG